MYEFHWEEKNWSNDCDHLNNIFTTVSNGRVKVSIYINNGCDYNVKKKAEGKPSRIYPIYVEFGASIFSMEWYRDSLEEVTQDVEAFIEDLGNAFTRRSE